VLFLKDKATERIGIRISPELKKRIEERAAEENRTLSNFIIDKVIDYLDKVDQAKDLLNKKG
jgi:uncharacterized protein (DUF1778 family)